MEGVNKELCDERNFNIANKLKDHSEELKEHSKELKEHAGEIVDLKVIISKLTVLVESVIRDHVPAKTNFWQTDSGKFIIKSLCVIGIAIVFAAIGLNSINYIKEYLGVIAK